MLTWLQSPSSAGLRLLWLRGVYISNSDSATASVVTTPTRCTRTVVAAADVDVPDSHKVFAEVTEVRVVFWVDRDCVVGAFDSLSVFVSGFLSDWRRAGHACLDI